MAHGVERGSELRARALVLGVTALALVVELVAVLRRTGGHFVYSLDDAYIHLALADRIAHGSYGLNAGEASSPSSSVIWPFLLAPFTRLPHPQVWPLVLDVVCTLATAIVLHAALRRSLPQAAAVAATCLATVALNLVGLAFTGMEHPLQVLLACLVSAGLLAVQDGEPPPAYLWVAMAAGPLVRYELMGFSVAAAIVLWSWGHRRPVLVATGAWVAGLAAFSLFLVGLGLDALPSSVLAKSNFAGKPFLPALLTQLDNSLYQPGLVVCVGILFVNRVLGRSWTRLHTFAVLVLAAHVVGGNYGWFGRYEVYLYAALAPVLVRVVADWRLPARSLRLVALALPAVCLVAALPLTQTTARTPAAARDIWSQQAQTAAFVREEWRAPIAVNDIGLVSFDGGQQVLDLWGLADADARRARLRDDGSGWVDDRVRQSGVRMVAVYQDWFEPVPATWIHVGRISGSAPVSSSERTVDLYVLDVVDAVRACAMLEDFSRRTSDWTRVSCSYDATADPGAQPA